MCLYWRADALRHTPTSCNTHYNCAMIVRCKYTLFITVAMPSPAKRQLLPSTLFYKFFFLQIVFEGQPQYAAAQGTYAGTL
mmetsp:Transcript_95394/g.139308  ORF Transcript_95394/g.139308 Transcript_95394/m.139308 type:complete len:81 (+) Transcript_95394:303-545(+)